MNMRNFLFVALTAASLVACDDGGDVPDDGDASVGECAPDETACASECVDTDTDREHCGACGTTCGVGQACVAGACELACPASQTACGDVCVDLSRDDAHCGACDAACAVGEACVGGACEVSCVDSQTACDGECVDTASNPAHCGACGAACDGGQVCSEGACEAECGPGLIECDSACVDPGTDPSHCGACDNACAASPDALGVCTSGFCRMVCDDAFADCNGDLTSASTDGCEVDTETEPEHCGACGVVCEADNAVTGCAAAACVVAMCDDGWGDCDGAYDDGCELDVSSDARNCGACGTVCTGSETCVDGVCTPPMAEDCATAVALTPGANSIRHNAMAVDYLSDPSCTTSSLDGPDLVLSYTATVDEHVALTFDKPTSTRWVAVFSRDACGTVTEDVCASEYSGTELTGELDLGAGETVFVYLADTTSGSDPLDNPLSVTVDTTACAGATGATVTALSPDDGVTVPSFDNEYEVTFDAPVFEAAGVVTLTGDGGTTRSYDLSTSPDEVSFDSSGTVMTIEPGLLPPTETFSIGWTGLVSLVCGVPVASPPWSVTLPATSCGGTAACADTCADAVPLSTGANSVLWYAGGTTADYLTATPDCVSTGAADGPDLVFSYTAAATEDVTFTIDKPTSTRWAAVVSLAACGNPSPSLACVSEYSDPTMGTTVTLLSGETAYLYLIDTTSGSDPLDNPVSIDVSATPCTTTTPPAITALSPADGASIAGLSPSLEVTFDAAVVPNRGTVTLTGDMGASETFDLATSAAVSWTSSNEELSILPTAPFADGETITVSWTGLQAEACRVSIPSPTWSFDVSAPSCMPGAGGVIGTTQSRLATGVGSFSEYYVAADDDPSGWIYFGGTSALYRVPKGGGAVEDVEALAGLSSELGYTMVIDGDDVYVVDSTSSGTTGRVFRITRDGGATWAIEDYATFPTDPSDDFRGAAVRGGQIYLLTHEASTDTEIWSVPAGGAAPQTATLVGTFGGQESCSGLAVDASFFYTACGGDDELVRVPRGGGSFERLSDGIDFSASSNALHGADLDADGTFDVLYAQGWYEESYFVCEPAGSVPAFLGTHVSFGSSNGNYGLGYDPGAGRLYLLDDGTREVIVVE